MSFLNTRKRRRSAVVAVVAIAAIGGGAAAFAYWSADGTGTGTATTGQSTAFEITSTPPEGDPLTPGGLTSQTVTFTVTNTDTATQLLGPVFAYIANGDGSTWTAVDGCSAADYAVTAPDIIQTAMAGNTSREGTVEISMVETGLNQDPCQNVTVPLYFTTNEPT